MLQLYLVKHNALFCTNYTAYRKKCAISRQSSASFTRPVAAKQPGPKPSRLRIWGLMQQRLYKMPVRDTIDLKKRLRWHMGQHPAVCRRRSRWPVDSTATRMREGKRSPVRTSSPVINRFFSEPPDPHHNRLFSEPPTFCRKKTRYRCAV